MIGWVSLFGAGFVAVQVWRTVHRPDLPSLTNQDISGSCGDLSLPPLRIVAVGDSLLTAPGLDDLDGAWLRRLAGSYADRHRVELRSLAVGGSLARDVVQGQVAAAVALRADVAVVGVGGNDVVRGVPVRRFAAALGTILGALEETCGAVVLVGVGDLGTIPRLPYPLRAYLSHRSALFDRACTRVAAAHSRTVRADTPRLPAGTVGSDPPLYGADLFHASAAGHALLADSVTPAFETAYRMAVRRRPSLPEA